MGGIAYRQWGRLSFPLEPSRKTTSGDSWGFDGRISIDSLPSRKRQLLLLPALYVLNCLFFSQWFQLDDVPARPWLLLVWLYGLVLLIPLVWRDIAPVAVFAVEWVLTVVSWPIMPLFTPVIGMPLALYSVAVQRSKKISLAALLVSFVPNGLCATVALRMYTDPGERARAFLSNIVVLAIVALWVWGLGRVTRVGQLHVQRLERERETSRNAVAEERRRIAHELHDIVSHAVTVIVLQAAGARRIAATNPSQVTQSLKHIETTGKQAMTELQRLLGVLKPSDPATDSFRTEDLEPQPGLKDIAALLNALRDTGIRVSVFTDGEPRSPDRSIELAAYRIVQEGLTNVLKHGGGDPNARLRLVWEQHNLCIEIYNDVSPAEEHCGEGLSGAVGLVGLRERVHAAGGRLHAGPLADGGYRLVATLPLTDCERQAAPMPYTRSSQSFIRPPHSRGSRSYARSSPPAPLR